MELNASELNTIELNGASGGGNAVDVEPMVSVIWDVRLMLNGVDASDLLTGVVRIEREEGARALADFNLLLDAGAVNPASYVGQSVAIYYRDLRNGAWVETLRFTGQVIRPQFNLQTRVLACECSDRLQEEVEAMDVAAIDALVGGLWSADVFEAVEGRSRWDYAQERLSTRAASLQRAVEGSLQVTPWATGPTAFVIPAGAVLDGSLDWLPVELNDRVNVVEVAADYRFIRLRERHQDFSWEHPAVAGVTIIDGFCSTWGRNDNTEVPDIAMIEAASSGAGYQAILATANWGRVPATGSGALCDPPFGWTNAYPDLLLSATWTSAMRWSQRVTEQYSLRVEAPASVAQAGEVISRERVALETESDREAEFEGATFTEPEADAIQDALGDWVVDLREEERRIDAISCLLAMAATSIRAAHRGNRLAFQLPTSDTRGFRLEHTLHVQDTILGHPVQCRARVFNLTDEWDLDAGAAITSIQLAVSQGGGDVADPLTPPAIPSSTPPGVPPSPTQLATQLGSRNSSPIYDDELDGFAGNYTVNDLDINPALEEFPRRFDLTAPEIPEEHRDEYLVTVAQTYRVTIDNDLLEL
ncbi:hypothetical protein [Metapseudomonas furukawaii]|uniref:Uncharacterized protein n=1 Tax=Metapseudomonas furukawaii TaxID=1149133 RepID=A0AAD1C3E6_METFU|nr:hypothetical protein [Pseudomonas furukawaii]ELS25684.1 hypothetical protein ppKF707_0780 [Pseudomonas furukawaii]BAU76127.1 hypothetical protein KF707C_44390 [Pseudomonas furukawaii]